MKCFKLDINTLLYWTLTASCLVTEVTAVIVSVANQHLVFQTEIVLAQEITRLDTSSFSFISCEVNKN